MSEAERPAGAGASSDGGTGYKVVVALGDPAYAEQLVRTAADLARREGGELLVVSVVLKSHDSPVVLLGDDVIVEDFGGNRQEILDRAVATVEEGDGVPVDGEVRVGSDLARVLCRAASDHDCDAMLVGWEARSRRNAVFGNNVDRIVARAPCDVLVEKIGPTADGVERILLPVAESPHAALAGRIADAIALSNDATVVAFRAIDPGADPAERREAEALLETVSESLSSSVETALAETTDVASAIVERSGEVDITVLGATRRRRLRRIIAGAIPREVNRNARGTVIMTRHEEGGSRLARLLGGWRS